MTLSHNILLGMVNATAAREKKRGFWGGKYAGMPNSGKEKVRKELLCECEGEQFLKTSSIFSKVECAGPPSFIINTPISYQSLLR